MRRLAHFLSIPALAFLASPLLAADFNGDGYADLAIGAQGEMVNGFDDAGAVHVLFGGPSCFGAITHQLLTEASFTGIAVPAQKEWFGSAITSGDFDGDGFDDIAIGAIEEMVSNLDAAGAVFVTYGSATGLDLARGQVFHQDIKGMKDKVDAYGPAEPGKSWEGFGQALASGDFDDDGFADLAIAVMETLGKKSQPKLFAGAVQVLRGTATGLTVKGNRLIDQDTKGVPGKSKLDAAFGFAMVAADFDQDGVDDLAVGAPGPGDSGSVTILRGKEGKGLSGKKSVAIDESGAGGNPDPLNSHGFGSELAAGDFAGDGVMRLAIGAPALDVDGIVRAGGVYVLEFSPVSLAVAGAQLWTRSTPDVVGFAQENSSFGSVLAAGDFTGEGDDDLAIGCPADAVGSVLYAGDVLMLVGSSSGLQAGVVNVTQDWVNTPGVAEYGDNMGNALAAADYDGDGDADLAIGVLGEDSDGVQGCGAVIVLEGAFDSLFDTFQSYWIDGWLPEIPGQPNHNDGFGSTLGN